MKAKLKEAGEAILIWGLVAAIVILSYAAPGWTLFHH